MPRSALIVDDSRTALASLSRLLKARNVPADLVESGPEALDYLRSNNPGVIFLDHMMPGMDGFETLSAIKSDPRTAVIPVVMYTSREGDAYMGQALVLGAFGVLQKPVNPDELELVLNRIDKLRPPQALTGKKARTKATQQSGSRPPEKPARPRATVTGVIHVPPELHTRSGVPPGHANAAPHTGIRNNVTADDSNKRRSTSGWSVLRRILLVLALLLPGVWLFEYFQKTEQQHVQLQQENAALRDELRAASELALARESSQQSKSDVQQHNLQASHGLLEAVTWALNRHGQYGYNDEPLGDARLALLRELIARLVAAGYQGTVRLETHIGEFCLVRDEQGNVHEPVDGLSFSRCEVVSYPPAQAVQLSRRQSPSFARYLADRRPGNPIQITVEPNGASRPLESYPESSGVQTAGDWNRIARLNQRVEIVLVPSPAP